MSMGNEHKSSADALTAILGSLGKNPAKADGPDETTAAPMADLAAEEVDLNIDDLATDGSEATLEVVDDIAEPVGTQRRQRRQRGAPRVAPGGRFARIFGLLCLLGGITTTVLDGQGKLPVSLSTWGYDSSILLALGTVTYVLGAMRRQVALSQVRIDALSFQQQEAQLDMQANLQYLVEQQQIHAEKPPAQGEELERVMVGLQRQDEKVNNLSRALKMYGKPLMEIANQGADVAAQVNQLKGHIEALLGAMQQGFTRVETAARGQTIDLGPIEQQLGTVDQQIARTATDLQRTLATFGERLPNTQALQQQLVRVEASVQALSQRAEDPEVRKSLVRLEDTSKLHGKKLDELAKQESVQGEVQKLERQLEAAIGKLNTGIEQVRTKNLGGLETSVRDMQRELASLATSVAYIQQAVKSGARPAATTPAAAAAPTHAAAMPAATTPEPVRPTATAATQPVAEPTAPRTPAPSAPVAEPVDTSGLNDAQAGVLQNKTGARAASGKNVLGAIAKLKKMKN